MRRALGVLAGAVAAIGGTAEAQADTVYGGATTKRGALSGTSIALLHRVDGRVAGRVGFGIECRTRRFPNVAVRLSGLAAGATINATGRTHLTRRGRLKVTLTGTMSPVAATGTLRVRAKGIRCRGYARPFVLRAETAPAGAPAMPAAGSLLGGLTTQAAGDVRLPITIKVSGGGARLGAVWQATMRCGPRAVIGLVNFTPPTRIAADATFERRERFRIRDRDGSVDRYRVVLRGRLLADGAVGTLRARMRTRKPGTRFYPCDSGVQRWTAAAMTG
jgi:hypothetical protein